MSLTLDRIEVRQPGRELVRTLECLIDNLIEGAALFDIDGSRAYCNTALARLLAEEPERERLDTAITRTGWALRSGGPPNRPAYGYEASTPLREVRTRTARYLIRGTCADGEGSFATGPVVVLVERVQAQPRLDADEWSRFHLTSRELEVARLLAAGHSTADVARTLGISIHTARRHSENLLSKVGVHSRAEALAKLRIN